MKKQTAANNIVLKNIKARMNDKVAKKAIELMNTKGQDAVLEFIGTFFNEAVRAARVAEFTK